MLIIFAGIHIFVVRSQHNSQWRWTFRKPLQLLHKEDDGVSNHQPCDCLLNRLLRRRWTKTWKICVTCLCEGNSPVTGEFPAQKAINADNVPISWRHHTWMLPVTTKLLEKLHWDITSFVIYCSACELHEHVSISNAHAFIFFFEKRRPH